MICGFMQIFSGRLNDAKKEAVWLPFLQFPRLAETERCELPSGPPSKQQALMGKGRRREQSAVFATPGGNGAV